MTMKRETIRETLSKTFYLSKYSPEFKEKSMEYWYDWFCSKKTLPNRAWALIERLRSIQCSKKFDDTKTYGIFKNNASFTMCKSALVDDFRICDIETGDVIYTVIPHTTLNKHGQTAEVWGRENGFEEPLVRGTWRDVKKFFLS